jgi:hypothetical protein
LEYNSYFVPEGSTTGQVSRIIDDGYAPLCYGIMVDVASVAKARAGLDLCSIELVSAQACAPGWSVDDVANWICGKFEDCVEKTVESKTERLRNLGAVQQDFPGCSGGVACNDDYKNAWVLPAGWNRLSDLKADEIARNSEGLVVQPIAFYGFNLAFLVVGIVGWLALIGGLVLGIVFGGGGEGDAAEK